MSGVARVFDPGAVLLAKHAQHVVLVHFPIALFITGVAFDLLGRWTKRSVLIQASYCNLLIAAVSTIPVIATGVLAWQFRLEGQKPKGILLLHLILGWASGLLIWLVWWLHFRARRRGAALTWFVVLIELAAVAVVGLTGHVGGFLSGVSGS
jgi:uncharacterized membrane protein